MFLLIVIRKMYFFVIFENKVLRWIEMKSSKVFTN